MKLVFYKSELADKLKKEGHSKNDPDSKFNKNELRIGTIIEAEHTKDRGVAKEVAKDHLVEDKNYYKKPLFREERKIAIAKLKLTIL